MKVEKKILSFKTVNSLIQEIIKDSNSHTILDRRYAVRFIMLDNFEIYQELVLRLAEIEIKVYGLEKIIENNKDNWITKDELINKIKGFKESYIVSPCSEIVRFYDNEKFRSFFNEVSLLENCHNNLNRRIYIPLIGLESRFSNFLRQFTRLDESAPVWSLKSLKSQPVTIYLTPNNESFRGFNFHNRYKGIDTMYDWLIFWKTNAPIDKIICSSLPININYIHSQPDNIFDIKLIENSYEFITKFLNLNLQIEYKKTEEKYWMTLLSNLDKSLSNVFQIQNAIRKHFNVFELDFKEIIDIWSLNSTKESERWLLKHYYLKHLRKDDNYLNDIIENVIDYKKSSTLLSDVALSIFRKSENDKFVTERNQLLSLFDKNVYLPNADLEKLKYEISYLAKENTALAIKLCTGRFYFENELFITWYIDEKLSFKELQSKYPDLSYYLSDLSNDSWVNSYIQAYKKAKLTDSYTDEVKAFIKDKNGNEESFFEWYHDFTNSEELLAQAKPDKTYWLDGVGIEYMSLIKTLINKSNFSIKQFDIAKAFIPSSTEFNSFENVIKKADLDTFIHSEIYKYPQTICKEIDIVKKIIQDIINENTPMTIAIVSDHGLTSLSRLVESKKYSSKSGHEGRYIPIGYSECIKDTDYICCKNNGENFKVALTHASLDRKPIREVHGGCTPEEVLWITWNDYEGRGFRRYISFYCYWFREAGRYGNNNSI